MPPAAPSSLPVSERLGVLPRRGMRAFIWDLADEGLENVLDRLVGSGVDGLYLDLIHQGGRFYLPHNPRHAMIHALDGAACFEAGSEHYGDIRPYIHPEYGRGTFLNGAMEASRDFGLTFIAGVSLFNNRTISGAHPASTCINALGDALQGALCPANPAVRSYALGVIDDLALRLGVDAVELRDFAYLSHDAYRGSSERGIAITPPLGYLLSLCFCQHCRARAEEANIDAEELAHLVERMIRAGMGGDLSGRRIADELGDPYHPVSRFAAVRVEVVGSLLDELSAAVEGGNADLQLLLDEEPNEAWRWGVEMSALNRRNFRATLVPGRTSVEVGPFLARYGEVLNLGERVAAEINLADCRDDADTKLRAAFEAAGAAGVDRFVFSHYGLVRLDMLEWVEALARRR